MKIKLGARRRASIAGAALILAAYGILSVWGQGDVVNLFDARSRDAAWTAFENQALYRLHGVISGTVRSAAGRPVAGIIVYASFVRHSTGARGQGYGVTTAAGRYTIQGLNDREFRDFNVGTNNEGKPWVVRAAQVVTLSPRIHRTENVDLTLDPGAAITIRARDFSTGLPVRNMPVFAGARGMIGPDPVGKTNASGVFVYHSPIREPVLRVDPAAVLPDALVVGNEGGFYQPSAAPGTRETWDVRVRSNVHNPSRLTLRGTVTNAAGLLVRNAHVELLRDPMPGEFRMAPVVTNRNGEFALQTGGIVEDSNASGVMLLVESDSDGVANRYLRPADTEFPIQIRLSETDTASVSGVVRAPEGTPLANVPVNVLGWFSSPAGSGNRGYSELRQTDGGVTDASGHFRVVNLYSSAEYQLSFGTIVRCPGSPVRTFARTEFPANAQNGRHECIRLKPGEDRNIGVVRVLPEDAAIAGRVVDTSGKIERGEVTVVARGVHTNVSTTVAKDGTFRLAPVPDEPLFLLVVYGTNGRPSYSDILDGRPESASVVYRAPVRAGTTDFVAMVGTHKPPAQPGKP